MFIVPLGKKDCQTCKIIETACDSTIESFNEELAFPVHAMVNLLPLFMVVH